MMALLYNAGLGIMAKHHYYTFKVTTPKVDPHSMDFQMEVHKWDAYNDSQPIETYKVAPANKTAVGGCTCPAWKWDCKHVKCCLEARDTGKLDHLWNWMWTEKQGWIELDDMDPCQAMEDFLND